LLSASCEIVINAILALRPVPSAGRLQIIAL
jgi:hypothetical protein